EYYKNTQFEYYLTKGEVFLKWGDLDDAEYNFLQAVNKNLKDGETLNPKIEAICQLNLAQISLKKGLLGKAERHLVIWQKTLSKIVDDTHLHYLGRSVREEIDKIIDECLVPDTKSNLKYIFQNEILRKNLIYRAVEATKPNVTYQRIADE